MDIGFISVFQEFVMGQLEINDNLIQTLVT